MNNKLVLENPSSIRKSEILVTGDKADGNKETLLLDEVGIRELYKIVRDFGDNPDVEIQIPESIRKRLETMGRKT